MYKTDRHRIEDCIAPAIFIGTIQRLVELNREGGQPIHDDHDTLTLLQMLNNEVNKNLDGLDNKKKQSLRRRLQRIVDEFAHYIVKEKFTTLKVLAVFHEWVISLHKAGGLQLEDGSDYLTVIAYMSEQFKHAPNEIEGWQKLKESSSKQVKKIHSICQNNGYFQ